MVGCRTPSTAPPVVACAGQASAATAGTTSNNPLFKEQSQGARGAGMFVGAVHFALPNSSSGTTQADYFMVYWISQFTTEVHAKTTRWPVIFTTTA